jgi:hypothetical protein
LLSRRSRLERRCRLTIFNKTARGPSAPGQSRHFGTRPSTSDPPPRPDIAPIPRYGTLSIKEHRDDRDIGKTAAGGRSTKSQVFACSRVIACGKLRLHSATTKQYCPIFVGRGAPKAGGPVTAPTPAEVVAPLISKLVCFDQTRPFVRIRFSREVESTGENHGGSEG